MNIDEYKQKVIDLFKSGTATEEQWQEMAASVLLNSEIHDSVPCIDAVVFSEQTSEAEGSYAN
jgi:hypothetical protein